MVAAERTLDVRLDGPSTVWPFTDVEDGDVMVGDTCDGLAQAIATVCQEDKDGGRSLSSRCWQRSHATRPPGTGPAT